MNETNNSITNYTSSESSASKIHQFENLPEPRNATEGTIVIILFINGQLILFSNLKKNY